MVRFGFVALVLAFRIGPSSAAPFDSGIDASDGDAQSTAAFSAIVVFGASYCDNGHPRPTQYSASLNPAPYYKGRWSNGPVFAEYLANGLLGRQLKLLDHAFGGAEVDNTVTPGPVPDTKTQVATYLQNVHAGEVDRGTGKVLHIWWIGINPLTQIFADAVTSDPTLTNATVKLRAAMRVDAESAEVLREVRTVRADSKVTSLLSNYLVLPVPPLEIVPRLADQASILANGNATLAATYLAYVGQLAARYNTGLINGVAALKAQDLSTWVRSYDVVGYWREVDAHPSQHGFTDVKTACYDAASGWICPTPGSYEYWDSLHMTTAAHRAFAVNLVPTINRTSTRTSTNTKTKTSTKGSGHPP